MKTIGLLGGMSWESSIEYYRIINEEVNRRLGSPHSASILMYSFDFEVIESLQEKNDWKSMGTLLVEQAKSLEAAGAEILLICANTMHMLAPEVSQAVGIPLVHIADAAGQAVVDASIPSIGLIGTRFTMEEDFYKKHLVEKFDLAVIVPIPEERQVINRIIYEELVTGKTLKKSRNQILEIISNLEKRGAEGIILGCTELPLLIRQDHAALPLFDTTYLHALAGVDAALSK